MAHVGLLKVLEELGIKPDYITGTSMGSIVGGLYAIGYSASEIEKILKRKREIHWGPRTIDIDILWAEDLIINTTDLIIPHPYLHKRDFILREINEIAPDLVHPVFQKKFREIVTTN